VCAFCVQKILNCSLLLFRGFLMAPRESEHAMHLPRIFIPVTRRVKGNTIFVGRYVTGRRKRSDHIKYKLTPRAQRSETATVKVPPSAIQQRRV